MASTPTTPSNELIPVYLPFATFRSAIQGLRAHGLPDRIEKTAWNSRSGADQTQILSAFRFLGFIDTLNDSPTESLKRLVDVQEDTDDERKILAELLQAKYARVFAINLKTATPGTLAEAIGSYGTIGATKKRAVRFFIKAATHARIPLSARLTANLRERVVAEEGRENGGESEQPTPRPRRRRRSSTPPTLPVTTSRVATEGESKTIQLKTGGSLTLTLSVRFVEMGTDDRNFVFELLDKMKGYEEQNVKSASE
jgi:hypothetical protein